MRSYVLLFASLLTLAACASDTPEAPDAGVSTAGAFDENAADRVATPTSTVTVDYRGTLADGSVFEEGQGVTFSLLEVIPGFQSGIAGMRVGETKRLVIPPAEGYGAEGIPGTIPPNATLTFDLTLHAVE